MGRIKQSPRYNIVSTRISDADYFGIIEALRGRSLAQYLQQAVEEKLIRDRQMEMDMQLQRHAGL